MPKTTRSSPRSGSGPASSRATVIALVVLVSAALAVRLAIGLGRPGDVFRLPDAETYRTLAHNLAEGHGLTMTDFQGRTRYADRMPGYPIILAVLDSTVGLTPSAVVVVQSLVGAAGVLLVFLLAREVAGPVAGFVAATMMAFEPWQVFFPSLGLTECWSATLLAATMLCVVRFATRESWGWAAGAGATAAALIYMHPEFLGLPLMFLPVAAIASGRLRWLAGWGLAVAIIIVALVPWWVRNDHVLGRPVLATTRLGVTLYDSFRPDADGSSDMMFEQRLAGETKSMDELQTDAYYRGKAWRAMSDDPGRVASLAIAKLGRLWSPVPNAAMGQGGLYRWTSLAGYVPMVGGALVGLLVLWRRRGLLAILVAPVVWVTAVHAILVGSIRYRVPVEPMLLVMVGVAIAWMVGREDSPAAADRRKPSRRNG